MQSTQSRRRFLATLSSAGAVGVMATGTSLAQEGPPETTTIRLARVPSIYDDPPRVGVSLRARFDAGDHVGFGLVDQLVGQTLEPGGQEGQDRSGKVARSASWGLTASTSGQVPFVGNLKI